jgi:hypothetical protein
MALCDGVFPYPLSGMVGKYVRDKLFGGLGQTEAFLHAVARAQRFYRDIKHLQLGWGGNFRVQPSYQRNSYFKVFKFVYILNVQIGNWEYIILLPLPFLATL